MNFTFVAITNINFVFLMFTKHFNKFCSYRKLMNNEKIFIYLINKLGKIMKIEKKYIEGKVYNIF